MFEITDFSKSNSSLKLSSLPRDFSAVQCFIVGIVSISLNIFVAVLSLWIPELEGKDYRIFVLNLSINEALFGISYAFLQSFWAHNPIICTLGALLTACQSVAMIHGPVPIIFNRYVALCCSEITYKRCFTGPLKAVLCLYPPIAGCLTTIVLMSTSTPGPDSFGMACHLQYAVVASRITVAGNFVIAYATIAFCSMKILGKLGQMKEARTNLRMDEKVQETKSLVRAVKFQALAPLVLQIPAAIFLVGNPSREVNDFTRWCFAFVRIPFSLSIISAQLGCTEPEYNIDFHGYDLTDLSHITKWEDCCAECRTKSGCLAWTHSPSDKKCWLKTTRPSNVENQNGRISGEIITCTRTSLNDIFGTSISRSPNRGSYSFNEKVTVSCSSGKVPVDGITKFTCVYRNTWDPSSSECIEDVCTKSSLMEFLGSYSSASPDKFKYSTGEGVSMTCSNYRVPIDGKTEFTCVAPGTWNPNNGGCKVATCSRNSLRDIIGNEPTLDPNKNPYTYGNTVTMVCPPGKVPDGGITLFKCVGLEAWDEDSGGCIAATCSRNSLRDIIGNEPTLDPNKDPYAHGDTVTMACPIGKVPNEGITQFTCVDLDAWDEDSGGCIDATCSKSSLRDIIGNEPTLDPNKDPYTSGDTVTMVCLNGKVPDGGITLFTCVDLEDWDRDSGGCIDATCSKASLRDIIGNEPSLDPNKDPYVRGDSVIMVCPIGKVPNEGIILFTCVDLEDWDEDSGACIDAPFNELGKKDGRNLAEESGEGTIQLFC